MITHGEGGQPLYAGSCLCGAVKFEVRSEFQRFYLCHCSYCRKDTGSAHAANLFAAEAAFRWVTGEDKVTCFQLPSTRHRKCFCAVCGSALPSMQMDGDMLVVPAGSLDTCIHAKPDAHIFAASRAEWDDRLAEIGTIAGAPE